MYGLDKSEDFQFLIGKELLQLCIGHYQLILNFTEQLAITVECSLRLTDNKGSTAEIRSAAPDLSKNLDCLIGSTIESVNIKSKGELILKFSHGYTLAILDSNKDTESFTITMPNHEIIV